MNSVYHADALDLLRSLDDASVDLIVADPPFGTGRARRGRSGSFIDPRHGYLEWIEPIIVEMRRVLKSSGMMYLHLDERSAMHVRVLVADRVFGPECYVGTVIWAYDYGGRRRDWFARKNDYILAYEREKNAHVFNHDEVDRIPYLAPGLQKDPVRRAAGKLPTNVWWTSIIGTQSKERVGYPTQKPVKLVRRIILASCPHGGLVVDPFAGSGTTAVAAQSTERKFIVSDSSSDAIETMRRRFERGGVTADFIDCKAELT